jgi:predicted nucleic acid-binding protein
VLSAKLAATCEPIIVGRSAFISFQTAAELRHGALRRGWGEATDADAGGPDQPAQTVHSGSELVVYAQLRVDGERAGHALAQREHDADRWIAATAVRLGIALVSNDRIFAGTPGLAVESAPDDGCRGPSTRGRLSDITDVCFGPQMGHNEWPTGMTGGHQRSSKEVAEQDFRRQHACQEGPPLSFPSAENAGSIPVAPSPRALPWSAR